MSSRDFTHELHRTTKTLGYSKVIETLQSMAKIQPSGANDIPTTFRQHRSERDSHNTLGIFGRNTFSLPQYIHHSNAESSLYKRHTGALVPNAVTITPVGGTRYEDRGCRTRHDITTPANPAYLMNAGRNNLVMCTAFRFDEREIESVSGGSLETINTGYARIFRGDFDFSTRQVLTMRDDNFQTIARIDRIAGRYYGLIAQTYDTNGIGTLDFYIDGTKYSGPHAANTDYYPRLLYARGPPSIAHVTQFTHWDAANFDIEDWHDRDRNTLVRDLTDPDITEWLTWRGFSGQLEYQEIPDAYG